MYANFGKACTNRDFNELILILKYLYVDLEIMFYYNPLTVDGWQLTLQVL